MSSVLALRLGILYRQEDLPFTHFGGTPDIVEQTCVFPRGFDVGQFSFVLLRFRTHAPGLSA